MIFLKKIELNGFKSYAQLTTITFPNNFVGIIGPNGSGKTNIVDAIRWVLGEISSKQLREENTNDIIFAGSTALDPSGEVDVKLFFDNSSKILNIDHDEVIIRRHYKRDSDNSEYFINGEQVKRKDIIDLFLNTGLSKDSLGIISQGKVQWFVDAKPEERRKIFEEASGIAKYMKIKDEYLNKLAIINNNLAELMKDSRQYENNIAKLEKQAKNAQEYLECKDKLKDLELFQAKQQYLFYTKKLTELVAQKNALSLKLKQLDNTNLTDKIEFSKIKKQHDEKQTLLTQLNQDRYNVQEQINVLERQASNYQANLEKELASNDKQTKINALMQLINDDEQSIKVINTKKIAAENTYKELQINYNSNLTALNKQKIKYDALVNSANELAYKIKGIKQYIDDEFAHEKGVKNILQNRAVVPGLIDPLNKLIRIKDKKYSIAAQLALGKNYATLVVESVNDAKLGIEFLRKNNAGVASFMPLDAIRPASIPNNYLMTIKEVQGYIGPAPKLFNVDEKYEIVLQSLIGNIIIVNNLQAANLIAKLINYSSKIISLDGDTIFRGGMITGGSINQNKVNWLTVEDEYKTSKEEFDKLAKQIAIEQETLKELEVKKESLYDELNSSQINVNTLTDKLNALNQNKDFHLNKLNSLQATNIDTLKKQASSITAKLSELEATKQDLNTKLAVQQASFDEINKKFNELDSKLQQTNQLTIQFNESLNTREQDIIKINNLLESIKVTANAYQLSLENLVNLKIELTLSQEELISQITAYKSKLSSFGAINLQAINELKTVKQQYEELTKNIEEVKKSQENLNTTINSIDKEMVKVFRNKIYEINQKLPTIFEQLFKKGKCELQFTDQNDLLQSGIEVVISQSEKHHVKLNSLSGGEKSIISLAILLTILQTSNFPLIILDEAESALDPMNAQAFGQLILQSTNKSQFIVVTHRKETMVYCGELIGISNNQQGITSAYQIDINDITNDQLE